MDERASKTQAVLLELAALDKGDFDSALRHILVTDAKALHVERVNYWALLHDPDRIACAQGYLASADSYERGYVLMAQQYPGYFRALAEEKVIAAANAWTDGRTREFASDYLPAYGIGAMLDAPVWVRGTLAGVLCHEHVGDPRAWTEEEQRFAISVAQAVATTLEVRERQRAERAERRAEVQSSQAEDALRRRDEFLSIAAHELYTPITSLQLVLQGLRRKEAPPESRQRIYDIAIRQTERLGYLVDELLSVSRIQAGRLHLRLEPVDLRAVVNESLEHFSDLLKRSGTQVSIDAPAAVTGRWDGSRLDQVVTNLVSNAIKFGERRPIRISVHEQGDRAVLAVTDHGMGIPRDRVPHLFQRFERAVSPDIVGGLGLGLYIVKGIVTALGGSIQVESQQARGSTFTVLLPRGGPQEPQPNGRT